MRLSREQLEQATGRSQGAAQARWFKRYLGATVPVDDLGPVVTAASFEAMLARASSLSDKPARPAVKLRVMS